MPYEGKPNFTKGRNLQQTVCTHVNTAQSSTHLADHLAQQGKTSVKDVGNEDTGSPSAKVVTKELRTRDPNTMKEEENRRRLMKLELMKIPL